MNGLLLVLASINVVIWVYLGLLLFSNLKKKPIFRGTDCSDNEIIYPFRVPGYQRLQCCSSLSLWEEFVSFHGGCGNPIRVGNVTPGESTKGRCTEGGSSWLKNIEYTSFS